MFAELRYHLRALWPGRRVFFLTLDPVSAYVNYSVFDHRRSLTFKSDLRITEEPTADETKHAYFRRQYLGAVERARVMHGISMDDAVGETYREAVHVLDRSRFRIGSSLQKDGQYLPQQRWIPEPCSAGPSYRTKPQDRVLVRLQDAIEFALDGFSTIPLVANRGEPNGTFRAFGPAGVGSDRRENRILVVDNYVERPGYYSTGDARCLLAEYAYSAGKDLDVLEAVRRAPGARFYLMPIRGLGQYRACADWIEFVNPDVDTLLQMDSLNHPIHPLTQANARFHEGVESLYSKAVIESLSDHLFDAIDHRHRSGNANGTVVGSSPFEDAFIKLYCADAVWFLRENQVTSYWERSIDQTLHHKKTAASLPDENLEAGVLIWQSQPVGPSNMSTVVLDLAESFRYHRELLPPIRHMFGFDKVVYRCPFVVWPDDAGSPSSKARAIVQWKLWATQLNRRLFRFSKEVRSREQIESVTRKSAVLENTSMIHHDLYHDIEEAVQLTSAEQINKALGSDDPDYRELGIVEILRQHKLIGMAGIPWIYWRRRRHRQDGFSLDWSQRDVRHSDMVYWYNRCALEALSVLYAGNKIYLTDFDERYPLFIDYSFTATGEHSIYRKVILEANIANIRKYSAGSALDVFGDSYDPHSNLPWPMMANPDDTFTREGYLGIILLCPRELLRNAFKAVRRARSSQPVKRYFEVDDAFRTVRFHVAVDPDERKMRFMVGNYADPNEIPESDVLPESLSRIDDLLRPMLSVSNRESDLKPHSTRTPGALFTHAGSCLHLH